MDVNGVPLHPLVVHAAVVLTPLAGVLAVVFALVPRWRWAVRWPLVVAAVAGAVAVFLASASGDDLKERLEGNGANLGKLIETHEMWAGRLQFAMWVLAAVAIIGAYVMPFVSPIAGRGERAARVGVLRIPVTVVLVLLGVAVLYLVYETGDAGAQMVWKGTPS